MSTKRYTAALLLAAEAHEGQIRKGSGIPYITHPVGVAALVAQYGGDEDQQIAGLLHDVLEDGKNKPGEPSLEAKILDVAGAAVLAIVQDLTDGKPDATGRKMPWKERKEAYLEHAKVMPERSLLVMNADKLYNARSIEEDLLSIGDAVFSRFKASKAETLWYYQSLSQVLESRNAPMARELSAVVRSILALSHTD